IPSRSARYVMKLRTAFVFIIIAGSSLVAQRQAQAPPVQSPRQALIEMITGDQKAMGKHLTVEVQQLLEKSNPAAAQVLEILHQVRGQAGTDVQTFETGPVLLAINQPRERKKLEVRVENDDLSGNEDTFELSVHSVLESSDQEPEDWEAFLHHFTVNLKKQAGIWRLNKVGVSVEFLVGDPEFLKKTFLKEVQKPGTSELVAVAGQAEPRPEAPEDAML